MEVIYNYLLYFLKENKQFSNIGILNFNNNEASLTNLYTYVYWDTILLRITELMKQLSILFSYATIYFFILNYWGGFLSSSLGS